MPDASGRPMAASAVAEVEAVIQTYFDALYDGDVEGLARAFHPCSHHTRHIIDNYKCQ